MNALDLAMTFGTLRLKADEERDDNIRATYLREMERIKDQLIDTEIVEPKGKEEYDERDSKVYMRARATHGWKLPDCMPRMPKSGTDDGIYE